MRAIAGRASLFASVALVLATLTGCTTGQYAGLATAGIGGVMMVGGFTTDTRCTGDHPCYDGGERITSGTEQTRPRSVPVGVVGAALVVGGAAMLIAFAPPPKKPPSASR